MSLLVFRIVVVPIILMVLIFGEHSVTADFSDSCVNSSNTSSCIYTYEQLYNSLAKPENSFNIDSALYPAKRPSSVRVYVDVYGPNKTENLVAKYTWSLSCLYVALPTSFLEIASLGSILVTPRTQALEINVPHFCCNVSAKEDQRRKTVEKMIERGLASLQDLATSPGIRDSRLNTAECVFSGHGLSTKAIGRNLYIIRTLFLVPVFSTLLVSQLLSLSLEHFRKESRSDSAKNRHLNAGSEKRRLNTAKAIVFLNNVLACISIPFLTSLAVFMFGEISKQGSQAYYFPDILIFCLFEIVPLLPYINVLFSIIWICREKPSLAPGKILIRLVHNFGSCATSVVIIFCSCWMLIGTMLNPTWGLTVVLIIFFSFAALTYAAYVYYSLKGRREKGKFRNLSVLITCASCFMGLIGVIILAVLAGQSFNGRETSDEILKTVFLTIIGSFISWFSWKRLMSINQKLENAQIQSPRPVTHHSSPQVTPLPQVAL